MNIVSKCPRCGEQKVMVGDGCQACTEPGAIDRSTLVPGRVSVGPTYMSKTFSELIIEQVAIDQIEFIKRMGDIFCKYNKPKDLRPNLS